jgi:methanogenic corrinoid protein MtbC1
MEKTLISPKHRVIIGADLMEKCGADAYANDAASGIKEIKRLLGIAL